MIVSTPASLSAMKYCSASAIGTSLSFSPWMNSTGVFTFAT
jgi:hypothetical protein